MINLMRSFIVIKLYSVTEKNIQLNFQYQLNFIKIYIFFLINSNLNYEIFHYCKIRENNCIFELLFFRLRS